MSIELINRVCELASEVGKAQVFLDQKDAFIKQRDEHIEAQNERLDNNKEILDGLQHELKGLRAEKAMMQRALDSQAMVEGQDKVGKSDRNR